MADGALVLNMHLLGHPIELVRASTTTSGYLIVDIPDMEPWEEVPEWGIR